MRNAKCFAGLVLSCTALLLGGCGESQKTGASEQTSVIPAQELNESGETVSTGTETESSEEQNASEEASSKETKESGFHLGGPGRRRSSGQEIPAEDVEDDTQDTIFLILPTEAGLDLIEQETICESLEEDYEIEIRTHEGNIKEQSAAFEEAIDAGAVMIICDNVRADDTLVSVQSARDAEIPTILINGGMSTTGVAVSQVITDRYSCIGRFAQEFAEYCEHKAQYLIVSAYGYGQSEDYLTAFRDALSSYSKIQKTDEIYIEEESSEEIFDEIFLSLREHPETDTIVCWSGEEAEIVLETFGSNAVSGKTVLCLQGDAISDRIDGSPVFAAILKPAEELAEIAAEEARSYLATGSVGQNECIYLEGEIRTAKSGKEESVPEEKESSEEMM
ncbi:MAG: substrate-binding domain-containing protein [Lachnospiraceae bacterium]|nr:substrate-binding domain-containing protein [Lachnospiraceae bacterium]